LGLLGYITSALCEDRAGSRVLEFLLQKEDNNVPDFDALGFKELISVACWYLWWLRRRQTHNESIPPSFQRKISVLTITANAAKSSKLQAGNEEKSWKRPEPRHLKLNVDASFHGDSKECATGAVLRDYQGRFIAACSRFLPNVASAMMVEALAMKDGLELVSRLGCSSVEAESDSTAVIDALLGTEAWWGSQAAIYADCIDLATNVGSIQFSHILREANQVADEIARKCFSDKVNCNWDDEPPSFLLSMLIHDVTEL
jgi:ribonuclease HI